MEGQVGPVQHRVPPPAMFYFDWHRVKILKKVAGTEQTSMVAISTDESEVNWLISLRYPKYLISVLGGDGSIKGYARSGKTRSSKHNMSHSQCWLQRTSGRVSGQKCGNIPNAERRSAIFGRGSFGRAENKPCYRRDYGFVLYTSVHIIETEVSRFILFTIYIVLTVR